MPGARAARIVLSLGLLAYVLNGVLARDGLDGLLSRLSHVAVLPVIAATCCQLLAVLINAARWGELLAQEGSSMPVGWLWRHSLIARFVGAFTPSTTGVDGYRVWEASRATGDTPAAVRALALEKCTGLPALALLTAACATTGLLPIDGTLAACVTGGVMMLAATGLLLLTRPHWLVGALPARFPLRRRLATWAQKLQGPPLRRSSLMRAAMLGLCCHAATAGTSVAAALALQLDVTLGTAFGAGCAIIVATLLPISVGGLGVREGAAVWLLGQQGIAATDALAFALLVYLATQLPALFGGLLSLQSRREAPQEALLGDTRLAEP